MNFKKLFLALSVLLASFSFQSCQEDEPAQPSNNLAGSSDKENQKEEPKEEQKESSFKDLCGNYKATYYLIIDDAFTNIDDLDAGDLIYSMEDVECKIVEGANNSLIFEDDIKFTNFVKDEGDYLFDVKSNNSDYHLIPVDAITLNGENYGGEFDAEDGAIYFACQVPVCEVFDDYSVYVDAMVDYWELDLDDPEDEEFFDSVLDDDYDNAMVYLIVKAEKK